MESGYITDSNQPNDDIMLRAQTQKHTIFIDISICMMRTRLEMGKFGETRGCLLHSAELKWFTFYN